ncbi:MAG: 3-hydroxyacyl-[acyl-carrier-protein] dehydratase [Thermotogota bacterium]|nr:3-hydroxyacyl-[acyl-carrier-protein] dehydratase [Thermotogota bacterium]MDK2864453.1 3-hydroxyacyl-[acyl-carrier-protein] dehydratase [Thermotogota bacterium]
MTIEEIMKVLPHRYPFLLVDGVEELEKGKHIKAFKNVSINEPYFQGHFPAYPIMPGVLILEGMAQAAGLMLMEPSSQDIPLFIGADEVRFRHEVRPGDRLYYEVEFVEERFSIITVKARALVGEKVCATAVLKLGIKRGG